MLCGSCWTIVLTAMAGISGRAIAARIAIHAAHRNWLGLVACAALAWTVRDGPVFMASSGDRATRFFIVLIVAFTLIATAIKLQRSVRPVPD